MTPSQGEQLRSLRTQAGLGVRELARRLGVSPSHISNIENGKRGASMVLLKAWARACGSEVDLVDPEQAELLEQHQQLDDDGREVIERLAEVWPSLPAEVREMLHDQVTGLARRAKSKS